jgi:DNA polymerase-3 subunit alpha
MPFTHLHLHTEYSLLDGLNRIKPLLKTVKEYGMDSVAITDHGVLYGAAEMWKNAKGEGIKPIIGCEVYLSPGDHKLKQDVDGIKYYHLVLLAQNFKGYQNLVKIVTIGQLEGMYYRPRVSKEVLAQYSEGIICTSACLAGPLARHILRNEPQKTEEWLKFFQQTYGSNFYLEVQRNGFEGKDEFDPNITSKYDSETIDTIKSQIKVNVELKKLSEKFNIPLVATTDAHYLKREDQETQEILFCIKDGLTLNDTNRRRGYVDTYVKNPDEMAAAFADDPTPLLNAQKIAESIEVYDLKFKRVQPRFWNLKPEETAESKLKSEVYARLPEKFPNADAKVHERLEYELMVINKRGYDDYFLVVADIMQYARSQGIVVNVRGSAGGSLVAYILGITNVDPLKWELYFERFLNLERPSPPDIDMDLQDDRREEVIAYVEEKYGHTHVAAISAFGRLQTKAAIRDVARVMGIDLAVADKLSKMVHTLFGKVFTIEKMMAEDPDFAAAINSDPELIRLAENVKKIEGMARHISTHPCGYLITPEEITNYVALQRDAKSDNKIITQFVGDWVDKLDLMKFDFLGLRNLTIIKNALDLIEQNRGVRIDLNDVPDDDKKAFQLFSRGDTTGVFQFESPPMQKYLQELQPETVEDICFLAAAYRPGPMKYIPGYIDCKHGRQKPEYITPALEPILGVTYGYPIYQEQLLKICLDISEMTMGEGDVLRNAMKKKQVEILNEIEPKFKQGVLNRGFNKEVADKLWDALLPFADYGFNKAHSASYAIVAYWCAYLKANYPIEFMAALMHSDFDDKERVVIDIKEAQRMGFKVLPPDINKSEANFSIEGEDVIRFGLGAIKNVGTKVCEAIVQARKEKGEFKNLDDLINKVGVSNLNKKALECLIQAGSMNAFGSENALLAVMPGIMDRAAKQASTMGAGQMSLFGGPSQKEADLTATPLPSLDPVSNTQKIQWEKEMLGLLLTANPMDEYQWIELMPGFVNLADIGELKEGSKVKVLAMIESTKTIRTKKDNKAMSFMTLNDMLGNCEAVMFPDTHAKYFSQIVEAKPMVVSGAVSFRNEKCSILVDEIGDPDVLAKPSSVKLDITRVTDKDELAKLKECFVDNGEVDVVIMYGSRHAPKQITRKLDLRPECIRGVTKYIVRPPIEVQVRKKWEKKNTQN